MANGPYLLGLNAFLNGSINVTSDTLKLALISTVYTPDLTADQFFNVVPAGAIIHAGVTLTGKSVANGILSADPITFTSTSGSQAQYLVLYKDTGVSSTSPLIAIWDTATGLPVTPDGGNIVTTFASGQYYKI